jgi:hypothetical protein
MTENKTQEAKTQVGYIYRIHHQSDPDVFYIGSTKQALIQRLQGHKGHAKKRTQEMRKFFVYLRLHNYAGFRIEALEEVEFTSPQTLKIREDHYIRTLNPPLNHNVVIRTPDDKKRSSKKYADKNRDKMHEYYEQNKAKIQQKSKKHYNEHKELVKALAAKRKQKNTGKFQCHTCNYATYTNEKLQRHCESHKHAAAIIQEATAAWVNYDTLFE